MTARNFNDERCGWSVATPHNLLSVEKAGSGVGTVTSDARRHRVRHGLRAGLPRNTGHADRRSGRGRIHVRRVHRGRVQRQRRTCVVTADAAKRVTATFADPNPQLTVRPRGPPSARRAPARHRHERAGRHRLRLDCSAEFASGKKVTLTAVAAAGSTFDGFIGGGCSGTAATCIVTVDQAKTVMAIFSGPVLTVTKAGDGAGTVTSDPLGIVCGVDC